ncbi:MULTISPECIES: 2OG-Fe(II) oxygenase [unclassified Streptomyces]|uniref:2OG-Fe(II) oxygenase n=1 Tax=unclassified Streptomyces TaxID=2593676 RepID=UPI003801731D
MSTTASRPDLTADQDRPADRARPAAPGRSAARVGKRLAAADWPALTEELTSLGCALTPRLLTPSDCRSLIGLYDETDRFRSTIDMARHRFGSGQYRYFAHPLPEPVQALRAALYPCLLPIARDWAEKLGRPAPWPDTLGEWLAMCHEAGQVKPSQILLRYGAGDWNALHRDIFGDMVFPLQVVIGLDEQGPDYTGGEFLLVEQRPRAQSRGTTTVLQQGHGLIFTTRDRPVRSSRGWSMGPVRHGVSTVRSGRRHSLGLVFHDA